MSYIDSILMPNERVVHRTGLHWVIFAGPVLCVIISVALVLSGGDGAIPLGGFLFLFGVVLGAVRYAAYARSEIAITNKRVLGKIGFIRRQSEELLLTKVETIRVVQGIIGRILGYGSVVVVGTGGTEHVFRNVPHQFKLRTAALSCMESLQPTKS